MAATFDPNGGSIATTSEDQTVRLWNGVYGTPLRVFRSHTGPVSHIRFSPDGDRLLSAGMLPDGGPRLWDLQQLWHWKSLIKHAWWVASYLEQEPVDND